MIRSRNDLDEISGVELANCNIVISSWGNDLIQ